MIDERASDERKAEHASAEVLIREAGIDLALSEAHTSVSVKVDVAYLRKANAIHDWFLTNVQRNVADGGHYDVEPEQAEELQRAGDGAMANRALAAQLLTCARG